MLTKNCSEVSHRLWVKRGCNPGNGAQNWWVPGANNGFGRAVLPAWSVQICEVSHCKNIIKTKLQGNILILMWDNISFGQPNWQRRCKMAGLWTANFTPQFAAISKISLENLSLKKVFCKCRRFLHRFMLNMRLLVVWKTYCKLSTHHHLI